MSSRTLGQDRIWRPVKTSGVKEYRKKSRILRLKSEFWNWRQNFLLISKLIFLFISQHWVFPKSKQKRCNGPNPFPYQTEPSLAFLFSVQPLQYALHYSHYQHNITHCTAVHSSRGSSFELMCLISTGRVSLEFLLMVSGYTRHPSVSR